MHVGGASLIVFLFDHQHILDQPKVQNNILDFSNQLNARDMAIIFTQPQRNGSSSAM
jgi:hypothetical protein